MLFGLAMHAWLAVALACVRAAVHARAHKIDEHQEGASTRRERGRRAYIIHAGPAADLETRGWAVIKLLTPDRNIISSKFASRPRLN